MGASSVGSAPEREPGRGGPGRTLAPPVFGLRKTWVDPVPGIAMVQLHYATSASGEQPDWAAADQVVLAPGGGGGARTAVLEVPRAELLLHHFFFVVAAERASSPVFTEQIVAREVAYEDRIGDHTSAGLVWGAVEADATNYSGTTMDGLPFDAPGAPADAGLYEFVRAQPLPHVFRGLVWGVRGTRVRYGWHLQRQGLPDPAGDTGTWDDNAGRGWTVDL